MDCPTCGCEIPAGNRFCGFCGRAVSAASQAVDSEEPRVSEALPEPATLPARGGLPLLPAGTLLEERFRVESFAGQGGFGTVYRAFDIKLERPIALKVLPLAQTSPRFLREAQSLAALNHPSIVTIFDAGEADGMAYIAMEFVEGESLGDRIRRATPPWDEMAEISLHVAGALDHAHQRGILHRDVKPSPATSSSAPRGR